jgi:hypothetical protein
MSGPNINDFLLAFSGESKYCLSIPVLWTVNFDGVSKSSINAVLSDAQESWRATVEPKDFTKGTSLLPAQEVTIPVESSSFQAMNTGNGTGGYLPGYALDQRSNFLDRSFTVNFLETKQDLEHEFFRPWMIAIGINGLVGSSLKANVEVRQYTNGGAFRKGYKFKKVFPTAVEGFSLNYNDTEFIIKSVTFACENYQQL